MKPEYHFITGPEIEKGIMNYAERNNLDLLIIIPKKHNLVHNLFRHSYSKNLVLYAHIPVLSIHE